MIKVYTDGASRGNPGKGGWGVVGYDSKGVIFEVGGSAANVTNNQMELTAMIMGLKYVVTNISKLKSVASRIDMYTDSQYVVKGMNEWRYGWVKNNWKNSQKKDVLNRELWERLILLDDECKKIGVTHAYKYVKGHAGDIGNERADTIATECADANSSHIVNNL